MTATRNAKADKLSALSDKALDKADAILDMDPEKAVTETGEIGFDPRIVSVQARIVDTVLRTQNQADANALRAVQGDKLDELLTLLRANPALPVPAVEHQAQDES